jgi:transcription antitermination factor NusG
MLDKIHIRCWYAAHTRSNHERTVYEALLARGIECFLPTYEAMSQWKDRRVLLTNPLFPGYLFARIPAADKLKLLTVPGVVSVLCNRPVYDAVDSLVELLRREPAMRTAEPHKYLAVGQNVTIVRGLFAGMQGSLLQNRNMHRVVICVPSIMRAFSVEVDRGDVRDSAMLAPMRFESQECRVCH